MQLIAESAAHVSYNTLKRINSQVGHTAYERVPKVGTALENLFREATINDLQTNAKLFDRMEFVFRSNFISKHIVDMVHSTRKLCNDVRHNGVTPNEKDYEAAVQAVAECVSIFSGVAIPVEVQAVYDKNVVLPTPAPVAPAPAVQKPKAPGLVYKQTPLTIRQQDLINNPTARLPIALCLDVSGSMSIDGRIDELNQGVKMFFDSVLDDEVTRYSVELSIVTFGSEVKQVLDFANIERQVNDFKTVKLFASGQTPMGQAVELSLDLLQKRKEEYQTAGVDYYQPWLVLMTDGQPTDSIDVATNKTAKLVQDKKLSLFPIAIGDGANLVTLSKFSPSRPPLKLNGLNFREFFEWLRESAKSTSQSTPGVSISLPPVGWAVV